MEGTETAVIEAPATPVVETPAPVTETSTERAVTPPDKAGQQGDKTTDRRTNPDALRKTLKWLRENGGEHSERAQDIERILGESKSYKTVYPTVREAREDKAALDSVGGRAKLAELQQYTMRMREVDELLSAGDPRVLEAIFETGTEGVAKLLPHLIEKLASTNAEAVQKAIQPHTVSFLDSQGLPDAIDAMVAAFNAGKPDDAKGILAKIIAWYKGLASAKPTESAKPAEQAAWEKERDQFKQKTFAADVGRAFDAAMTHAEQAITRELAPYLKKYGIPADRAEIIAGDVWKRIEKERNADELFKAGISQRVNERSRKIDATTADFLKAQVDQRVKEATRKEIELRYGFIKREAPATEPPKKGDATAAPAGSSVDIDHAMTIRKLGSKSAAQDSILAGKAFNSAGKAIVKQGRIWKFA